MAHPQRKRAQKRKTEEREVWVLRRHISPPFYVDKNQNVTQNVFLSSIFNSYIDTKITKYHKYYPNKDTSNQTTFAIS